VIANEKYKHISIVKVKAGGSKIANDIDDPQWTALGVHRSAIGMTGTNITYPYETLVSCIDNHTWTSLM
jgi:hypothetical protein